MRREIALACLIASAAPALAQTVPAEMGITPSTTPEVLQTLDNTKTWVPLGTVDSSTHTFTPVGGGGGGGGSGPVTLYATHALLTAGVATPTGGNTVQQQGFYAAGDGGQATYQWSLASYCTGGTSGAPTPADGIACVLPVGQSASTAGRYLLQLGNGIDVRQIGMVADGVTDNFSLVPTLMHLVNPDSTQGSGLDVFFPAKAQQRYTDYYFSQSFHVYRLMNVRCQGVPNGGGDASTRLKFPAGVHGVVFDNYSSSPDGTGDGGGGMSGCGVVSSGWHEDFTVTTGSNPVIAAAADKWFNTWDFEVGDGVIIYLYGPTNGNPALPGGTTIAAVDSIARTITPSAPVVSSYTGHGWAIWRLPIEKAFTVNTVAGQPTVTVTGGPDVLRPGDFVWSDAFPFGSTVLDATGTVGAQTVTLTTYSMNYNNTVNATVTHTSGSPGHMWLIPAAVKMYVQTALRDNYLTSFGFGLEMECSFWSATIKAGCNGALAQNNVFVFNIIGRLVMGDNAGASTSIMNEYGYNSFSDIVEGGAVGSSYFGENTNSPEASTSIYGIVGECVGSNSSSFFGGYNSSFQGYCLNNDWVAHSTSGGEVVFWSNQAATPNGSPAVYNSNFINHWYFAGNDSAQTQLCMNKPNAPLSFSHGNQSCGGPATWNLQYDTRGFWTWYYFGGVGGSPMIMTEGATGGYTGYLGENSGYEAYTMFPQGFLLYDAEGGYTAPGWGPGSERMVDLGGTIPTGTFHQYGDVHFDKNAGMDGHLAWVDTGNINTTLGAAVVSGTTTTVPVASCPTPALPAGTPIMDYSLNPNIPVLLGTAASCISTTLTFQATATHNAANGDIILFMLWKAAGPVANDTAGTSWTLGNYMTLTPVALASLPATCTAGTFAVINNGVAAPVYNAAVGSTTGAATDPVFCGAGNNWTYH